MIKNKLFVMDTNVFVDAHRRYYAFDIAPGFWDKLLICAGLKQVVTIKQVLNDLKKGHDPIDKKRPDKLAIWTQDKFKPFIMETDDENVVSAYTDIVNWVHANPIYPYSSKYEFMNISDIWVIAYAKAIKATLVTGENKIKTISKIPIPAVCKQFNVEFIDTFDMLRRLEVTLS